jgi:endonuclease/exonuclease/phosphatase (EEP) superfamily protein YafD
MQQIRRVIDAIRNSDGPIIVLCDCNLTETTTAYARLDQVLEDAFGEVGWGFGHTIHPAGLDLRLQRIDYVWYTSHFVPLSARVIADGTSDHYALVVQLGLPAGE